VLSCEGCGSRSYHGTKSERSTLGTKSVRMAGVVCVGARLHITPPYHTTFCAKTMPYQFQPIDVHGQWP
jgi:hypothetical protein